MSNDQRSLIIKFLLKKKEATIEMNVNGWWVYVKNAALVTDTGYDLHQH